ncbi:MAG: ribosome-binding factor A [Patescibacteria group bacterium]
MNERRRERLSAVIKEILPAFFRQELILPNGVLISVLYAESMTSGTRVTVYVSIFPDNLRADIAKILEMSENRAAHFLRARLRTKYSPSIHFVVSEEGLA